MSGTHFRALRARGAREAGFFFMDQFLLPRRFQQGITHPWESSGSMFAVDFLACAISPKTHHLRIYLMRADVPMVLL